MNRLRKYEVLTILGIVILSIVFFLKGMNVFNFDVFYERLHALGYFAPVVFFLIFVLLALLGFPVSALYVLTGLLFGLVIGFFISVLGSVISAIIAFLISRKISDKFLMKSKRKTKHQFTKRIIDRIKNGAKEHGFLNILLLRMYSLPFIELSYAAGLVRELRVFDFAFASFVVIVVESFLFIFLGSSVGENLWMFVVAISLILLFVMIPRFFKRHHLNFHFHRN